MEVWGQAEFPKSGLWNVHGPFLTHAIYASGVTMDISGAFPNGIKFYGSEGWIFVTRDNTQSPDGARTLPILEASDPKILTSVIGCNEVRLYRSDDQHGNWLDCIRSRKPPIAPAEIGHRACSTCLIHHMAMHTGRRLHWDPAAERFHDDVEANARLSRPQRKGYGFDA